jgi:protein involved in polysaccharide export with SLBB domain
VFVATSTKECADCSSCNGKCATTCAAELQRTGLDPYRIEPPDVLSVFIPMLEPKCADVRAKLTAKGISFDTPLPFSNLECERIVGPDGRIAIQGIGEVHVSGKTVEEARLAITKTILEACPQAKQAAFAVIVDVSAVNSKKCYVITKGAGLCDNVMEFPINGNETVLDAISRIGGISQVSSVNISIARLAPNGVGCEQILPVNWDEITRGGNTATNYHLLPGDRLYVKMAKEPAPPRPAAVALPPIAVPPTPFYAPKPAESIALTLSPPISPITPYAPCEPCPTYYTATLEAAGSPFARQASPPGLPTPLIAPQTFITTAPPQAPAAPIAQAPQCATTASECSAASCATCPTCGASQADSCSKATQVLFAVDIIEDHTGSMEEFKSLQCDMPILTAQSEVILPTIRILEKQELVRRLSSPKIAAVVDRPAQIQLGSEVPDTNSATPSFHGLMLKTTARELGGGLNIDFQFKDTSGSRALEVETSLLVAHGQSIVMKTSGRQRGPGKNGDQKAGGPAVYVVLTPELVR